MLVHALVATNTHDQPTAQRAWDTLADDRPPPLPWQREEDDDERWSEQRLEADLLAGVRWPFFRARRVERAISNGHGTQEQDEEARR